MIQDIIKKESLSKLNIVGGMLVSRAGSTLKYSIPNLLKWCNDIIIVLDNEDEATLEIIKDFKDQYPDRLHVEDSGFKRSEGEEPLLVRFKRLQGPIRERVFMAARRMNREKKIDILIYPDSDEIFGDYFEELLLNFWKNKDFHVIKMRCVWPFGDLKTIGVTKMCSHVRVFKFTPKITTYPWRHDWLRHPTPFKKGEFLRDENTLIHLSHLTDSMIKWRAENWRSYPSLSIPLWTLEKDVRKTSSEEIKNKLKESSNLTIGDYLKKHGKNFTN